jgi:hypothetical protein
VLIHLLQELFVKVYEFSVSGKKGNHGSSGYYFAESGEYTQSVSCLRFLLSKRLTKNVLAAIAGSHWLRRSVGRS